MNIDIPENREKFRSFFGGLTKKERDENANKHSNEDGQRFMDLETGERSLDESADDTVNGDLKQALKEK